MLALENLGRKVSEERPQVKFARNPNYGDDVKWLMTIAKKLGKSFLSQILHITLIVIRHNLHV